LKSLSKVVAQDEEKGFLILQNAPRAPVPADNGVEAQFEPAPSAGEPERRRKAGCVIADSNRYDFLRQ
jgi:hypothetical protein